MDPEADDFKRAVLPKHGELTLAFAAVVCRALDATSVNRSPTVLWLLFVVVFYS